VFVAFLHNSTGSPTFSAVSVNGVRAILGRISGVGSAVQTGWTVASTYPTIPDPYGTPTAYSGGIPYLGLQVL